jgi:hypothetical protein
LKIYFKSNSSQNIVKEIEDKFEFVKYNPRKNIDRWGLSITSLDGTMSGIPDLDSLLEYNRENNTSYEEEDFYVPTLAYNSFNEVLHNFEPWLFRTHVLKLNPGGFFPPHRDVLGLRSFRLIVPLKNCKAPTVNFIVEDKILNFEEGRIYFIDTIKMHYIFNASDDPSYWLIMNVKCNEKSVEKVLLNLMYT